VSLTSKGLTWILEEHYCAQIAAEDRCRVRLDLLTAWRAHLRRRMRQASIAAGAFLLLALVSAVVGRFV
jgi:hypothetical protein